jgi:hypothetical protein
MIAVLHSNKFGQPTRAQCDEHDPPAVLELPEDGGFHELELAFRMFVKAHRTRTRHL